MYDLIAGMVLGTFVVVLYTTVEHVVDELICSFETFETYANDIALKPIEEVEIVDDT